MKRSPVHAWFRADASDTIGYGHLMRCLALAGELAGRGVRCHFISRALRGFPAERIHEAGHDLLALPGGDDRHGRTWSVSEQAADARASRDALGPLSACIGVVDHYGLDAHWQRAMQGTRERVLVIDDFIARKHECDLLLDQGYLRTREEYQDQVPPETTLLTGSRYALLRPAFRALRGPARQRRRAASRPQNLLIMMGGRDPSGLTAGLVEHLAPWIAERGLACRVVLNHQQPGADRVREILGELNQARWYDRVEDPAELMTWADIALGACGSTSWERGCLGLPGLLAVLAENQRDIARALASTPAVVLFESPEEARAGLQTWCTHPEAWRLACESALSLADGLGRLRVGAALFPWTVEDLQLEAPGPGDLEALADGLFKGNPQPSEEDLWMLRCSGEPCGLLRTRLVDTSPVSRELRVAIDPAFRDQGLLSLAVRAAALRFPEELRVRVLPEHGAARRLLKSLGWKERSPTG